jgi:hypothetical protein
MRKFFASILLALTLLLPLFAPASVVHAQNDDIGPWYDQSYDQWFTKVYGGSNPQEIFGERYTAAQVQWIFYSIKAFFLGLFIDKSLVACFQSGDTNACASQMGQFLNPIGYDASSAPTGIAGFYNDVSGTLGTIISTPREMSGITHIKGAFDNSLIPNALAQDTQGTGFRGLSSVQRLWQAARDVTYVLMILVIISMAFMIMFKTQLPSKAVITVQSSLWKVFTTLVLITFSYAIAGFMIDLMYVSIGLVALIFTQTNVLITSGARPPALEVYESLVNGPNGFGAVGYLMTFFSNFVKTLFLILYSPTFGDIGLIIQSLLGVATGWAIVPIIAAVLIIVLFFMFFKIMWMLIKTFVNIILLVITAPFQILIGAAFPGKGGFGSWFSNMITNLAVYPVVGGLFLLSYIFLSGAYFADVTGTFGIFNNIAAGSISATQSIGFWFLPFATNPELFCTGVPLCTGANNSWAPPLTMGGFIPWLWLFASFVCLSMIPKTVELVQGMLSGKGVDLRSSLGESVAPISGTAMMAGAFGKQFASAGATGGAVAGASNLWGQRKLGATDWRDFGRAVTTGARQQIKTKTGF